MCFCRGAPLSIYTKGCRFTATKHRSPATWKRANGDYAGHNDSRLHRRIQSVEHIAKLAEAKVLLAQFFGMT